MLKQKDAKKYHTFVNFSKASLPDFFQESECVSVQEWYRRCIGVISGSCIISTGRYCLRADSIYSILRVRYIPFSEQRLSRSYTLKITFQSIYGKVTVVKSISNIQLGRQPHDKTNKGYET